MDSYHYFRISAALASARLLSGGRQFLFSRSDWRRWLSLWSLMLLGIGIPLCGATILNKDGYPLPMSFESSHEVLLLFSFLRATTPAQYAGCCCLCVCFGYVSIALKALRRVCEQRLAAAAFVASTSLASTAETEEEGEPFPLKTNFIRGCVACLNYGWDYMLMLVAMTFNVGIFVSLLAGFCLGFLTLEKLLDYQAPIPGADKTGSVEGDVCGCDFQNASCGCHVRRNCTCVWATALKQKLASNADGCKAAAEETTTLREALGEQEEPHPLQTDAAPLQEGTSTMTF